MPGTGITGACCCIVWMWCGDGRSGHDNRDDKDNTATQKAWDFFNAFALEK
jgi:hypothetical protein